MAGPVIDREALRNFAHRDYEAISRLRAAESAERYQQGGAEAAWNRALALREHMRTVRPDWPTAADRAEDLSAAIALAEALSRAGRAIAGR